MARQQKNNKLISIVAPAYNEAQNIPAFYDALVAVMRMSSYKYELLFVNDGSSDDTQHYIDTLCRKHKNVRCVEFVRNFGKEIALTAGLEAARGDAVLMIDVDLQHPVDKIPEFIKAWEQGAEHIVGIRTETKNIGWFKKRTSKMFYDLINRLSQTNLQHGMTDFQLVDRVVVEEFKRFTERNRITRGLLSWLGFPVHFIEFTANDRHAGEATYTTLKLVQLAANSFVSLSLFPLRIAGYLGLCISALSSIIGVYMYIDTYLLNDPFNFGFTGTGFLAMLLLFVVGLILSCLGLVALYIGAIHGEVLNRPLYVARKRP